MRSTPIGPSNNASLTVSDLMWGGWQRTPVAAALLVGNLAVFVAMLGHGAALWHTPNDVQLAWGANFGPATRDGEWWRLGTAMFVHFGIVHLAINMWALWDSCRFVERLYGQGRFLVIYGAGGMAGSLFSLLAHGDSAVSGGASGAIFSAYGALLVWLWRERRQIHPVEFRWLFGGAAAFAAVTIVMGLLDRDQIAFHLRSQQRLHQCAGHALWHDKLRAQQFRHDAFARNDLSRWQPRTR